MLLKSIRRWIQSKQAELRLDGSGSWVRGVQLDINRFLVLVNCAVIMMYQDRGWIIVGQVGGGDYLAGAETDQNQWSQETAIF